MWGHPVYIISLTKNRTHITWNYRIQIIRNTVIQFLKELNTKSIPGCIHTVNTGVR